MCPCTPTTEPQHWAVPRPALARPYLLCETGQLPYSCFFLYKVGSQSLTDEVGKVPRQKKAKGITSHSSSPLVQGSEIRLPLMHQIGREEEGELVSIFP